jgi:hypothetical protein
MREREGFGSVFILQSGELFGNFVESLIPGDPLPLPLPLLADPFQRVVEPPGMIDVIEHQPAALAEHPARDRVVRVAGDFDDFAVFHVQQHAASGMT